MRRLYGIMAWQHGEKPRLAFLARRICAVLAVLMLVGAVAAAQGSTVDSVTVSVRSDGVPPPTRVTKRMELSVATVGEHVLIGKKVTDIAANSAAYEAVIKEVFDRVLVGYFVQDVTIVPGPDTQISVVVKPWGEVVREVSLETDFGNLPPVAIELIKQDMGNIQEKLSRVLVGMPVDALDWAGSMSKTVIRESLSDQLPEFRVGIEFIPGPVTVAKLSLTPIGPIVRDVSVTLRSRTLPNLILLDTRPTVEAEAAVLRGLPVAFVERHNAFFAERLKAAAARHSVASRYGFELTASLIPGFETVVLIETETTKYNIGLEAYLDMGRTEYDTSLRLHIGKKVGNFDELFLETTFIPSTVSWEFVPGWGHRLGAKTEAGAKYNLSDDKALLWLRQDLGSNWMLRLERTPADDRNELGVRYKLHDYLSVEYVFTNDDNWLRLIGNL
ncbi:MAG TPA: hypothetical protein PKA10_09215 [Selenomonadales bacterium]|nr:hypothetical protein [Selenomonadales bacterium]